MPRHDQQARTVIITGASAGVGRGIATSGGTGAGAPITTGVKPPRRGICAGVGAFPVGGTCASAKPVTVRKTTKARFTRLKFDLLYKW